MSHPTWYPKSPGCKDCVIKCTIDGSAQSKYLPGGTAKPTTEKCPYGIHGEKVEWEQ